ncbi:MAG: 30S ribosomal protein S2 [Gemmatimonadota bacterium]|nr:MAG: 30S ribosomal protein S2 [Gemmatimonadota bacterium]
MTEISLRDLLEAGVHFGHQTARWNPKMRRYIFLERNGIYILDLQKTKAMLERAQKVVRDAVAAGGTVMFVGTKKQAKDSIREAAEASGQFYVTERWLGGMLTNFQTIRQSLNRFIELERRTTDGTWELIGKKERLRLEKELSKLDRVFHGIKTMDRPPAVLFVVDTNKEKIAVSEARKLNIPVIGLVDTNSDPELISHPIPGNDDAIRSIQLMANAMAEAVKEGSVKARDQREAAEKASADAAAEAEKAKAAAAAAVTAPAASE